MLPRTGNLSSRVATTNADPGALAAAVPWHKVGAQMLASSEPTCFPSCGSSSIRDYFVVSRCLANVANQPRTLSEVALPTHRPVSLAVYTAANTTYVKILAKAEVIPLVPPFGPRRKPNDEQWSVLAQDFEQT